jgi:hypothetical protein
MDREDGDKKYWLSSCWTQHLIRVEFTHVWTPFETLKPRKSSISNCTYVLHEPWKQQNKHHKIPKRLLLSLNCTVVGCN